MRYLGEQEIKELGVDWNEVIDAIGEVVIALRHGDIVQPIKPYLRFNNPRNRIIAMPAFVGGGVQKAGIKWIASFPGNLAKGLPRANSVTIINNSETGVPEGIVNTSRISAIRTAAVSGAIVRKHLKSSNRKTFRVGIAGFGPIAQLHLEMIMHVLPEAVDEVKVFDIRPVDMQSIDPRLRGKVSEASTWQEAYEAADIFITCTVAEERYIDQRPPQGSLQLNVSLRDYHPSVLQSVDLHVVDSWQEVCRENTDIEKAHNSWGLQRSDVLEIDEYMLSEHDQSQKTVMFNPMGMAAFDITMANLYLKKAEAMDVGALLQ